VADPEADPPRPLRLGLIYAALYCSTGVSAPYLSVWLNAQGLPGSAIGAVLAAPLLGRAVTGPLIAVWADGFHLRRTAIVLMTGAAAALDGALLFSHGFIPALLFWFASATLFNAASPLVDVIVLRRAARQGFPYALPRSLGSAAYVGANLAGGALIGRFGPVIVVPWVTATALATTAAAPLVLGAERVGHPAGTSSLKDRFAGVGALMTNKAFVLTIVSAGLIQAAHAFYYSFSALIWRAQGLSAPLVGLLWGTGVAAEVAFLLFLEPWRRRVGPVRLLLLGGGGACVRWLALAFSPPVALLFPLQTLHALSFTATFVASLSLVERFSPPQSASAAQSLNAALYSGVLIGLATLASGPLFDRLGAHGYLAMALLALLGLAGALGLRSLSGPQDQGG